MGLYVYAPTQHRYYERIEREIDSCDAFLLLADDGWWYAHECGVGLVRARGATAWT